MKKIIVLAVILFAVPAMAAVTITVVDNGNSTASIQYSGLARAFALDIQVDSGATITAVSGANASFNIYPGTIVINSSGVITNTGSPIAPPSAKGALGGLGTDGITIEMGSLYKIGTDPAPPSSGTLLTIQTDKACCVTVTENAVRGGVVLENATHATVIINDGCITGGSCACPGDGDSSGYIDLDDLYAILNILLNTNGDWYIGTDDPRYNICYDIAYGAPDGYIDLDDLYQILNWLLATNGDWYIECP